MVKADNVIRPRSAVRSVAGISDLQKSIVHFITNGVWPFNQLQLANGGTIKAAQLAQILTHFPSRAIWELARHITKEQAINAKVAYFFNNADKEAPATGASLRANVLQVAQHILRTALPHLLLRGHQFDATVMEHLRDLRDAIAGIDDDALVRAIVTDCTHCADTEEAVQAALLQTAGVVSGQVAVQWLTVALDKMHEKLDENVPHVARLRSLLQHAAQLPQHAAGAQLQLHLLLGAGLNVAIAAGYEAPAPAPPPAPAVAPAIPPMPAMAPATPPAAALAPAPAPTP